MKNNQKLNEVALNTVENLADEIIFKTATTFLEDLTKSIPVASILLNLTTAYSNYQTSKNQQQLLSFITQLQSTDPEFIKKFFLNKSNAELGLEILGILDQTYLEKQARMLGKATLLLKEQKINKQDFDKMTYIITRLNNHLFDVIEDVNILYLDRKHDHQQNKFPNNSINIQFPNMELLSFGFLQPNQEPFWGGDETEIYKESKYQVTEAFINFYTNIFQD